MAPFRKVGSLADAALVLHCGGFVTLLPLLLRLPLPRLAALLEPRRSLASVSPERREQIADLVTAVVEIQRLLPANCLPRGLTCYYFLRRAGVPVSLCFGMGGRAGGEYNAHCWLQLEGEPYREEHDPRPIYAEFYRFPTGGAEVSRTAVMPKVSS